MVRRLVRFVGFVRLDLHGMLVLCDELLHPLLVKAVIVSQDASNIARKRLELVGPERALLGLVFDLALPFDVVGHLSSAH